MSNGDGLAQAVEAMEWDKARHLLACRVAESIEHTQSAREVKALSLTLSKLIDACEESRIGADPSETPLDRILGDAAQLWASVG